MMSDAACKNVGLDVLTCEALEVCYGSQMEWACRLDEMTSHLLSLAQRMSYMSRS